MIKSYTKAVVCSKCRGTGIEYYYNHGYGEDSIEPIKCTACEGFGSILEKVCFDMPIIEFSEEAIKLFKEWSCDKYLSDPEVKKFYENITKE